MVYFNVSNEAPVLSQIKKSEGKMLVKDFSIPCEIDDRTNNRNLCDEDEVIVKFKRPVKVSWADKNGKEYLSILPESFPVILKKDFVTSRSLYEIPFEYKENDTDYARD